MNTEEQIEHLMPLILVEGIKIYKQKIERTVHGAAVSWRRLAPEHDADHKRIKFTMEINSQWGDVTISERFIQQGIETAVVYAIATTMAHHICLALRK